MFTHVFHALRARPRKLQPVAVFASYRSLIECIFIFFSDTYKAGSGII